ncbi:MAG: hypothetical protein HYY00_05310 [Chloroflexi bacterium]|nr:hypothetical protein [Chloroflexota bacterium]
MSASGRWLVAIAAVVAVLVVVSVVVTLVSPRGKAVTFPEDTAEGVVQRFIVAIRDGDENLAHGYLSENLKKSCTAQHIRDTTRWLRDREGRNQQLVLLGTQTLSDGRAEVRVRVTDVNVSPPFGVNEYSHEERYVLVREGDAWRFDQPPWPVSYCPDLERVPAKPGIIAPPG